MHIQVVWPNVVLLLLTVILFGVIVWAKVMGIFDTHAFEKFKKKVLEELATLRFITGQNNILLHEIRHILKNKPHLVKGKVKIMPKQIQVGETAQAVLQGVDQFGQPFPLDATYTVVPTASNPSDVSVGPVNPDGSFTLTGIAADAGDSIGAQVTRPDGTVISFTPDVLTIVAPAPVLTGGAVVLQ